MERIFKLFDGHGESYLVGGSVRDKILGIDANDFDFAVSCSPEETKRILEESGYKTYDVGKAYGTISVVIDNIKCELTTFRRDVSYARDNRHPIVEWGKTIEEDLARRDFKINCLALDSNNNLIDPFNGVEDLKNKIIDTPIEPEKSFSDDSLRLLRCLKFKAKLGFNYSNRVKIALRKCASRILILSRERILDELNKILMTDDPAGAFKDLMEFHLLHYIIPELTVLKNVEQFSPWHCKDVWDHTLGVLQNIPKDLTLRWAAAMHDIAKPYVISYSENIAEFGYANPLNDKPKIHFYEHDELGSRLTYSILCRLGLPNKMIKDITYLVRNHMRANIYEKSQSDAAVRRFIKDTGVYCDGLLSLSRSDITSHNPKTVALHLSNLEDLERRIEEQRNFKESPKCPVSGLIIMSHFNLPPCKKVGEIKDLILNAIIAGELKMNDKEESMLEYAKEKMEIKI